MKKNLGRIILTTMAAVSVLSMTAFAKDSTVVGYGDPVSAETAEKADRPGAL